VRLNVKRVSTLKEARSEFQADEDLSLRSSTVMAECELQPNRQDRVRFNLRRLIHFCFVYRSQVKVFQRESNRNAIFQIAISISVSNLNINFDFKSQFQFRFQI
jgi:hypothetical protein